MSAICTGALIGTIVVLSFLLVKLLGILVGTLIVYLGPILVVFAVLSFWGYLRFTRRGRARARRWADTFGDRRAR